MKHNPRNPHWFDRDRFVLSAGRASMLLSSTLHLTGYGVSLDDLKNFRQLHSPTPGHPEYREAPGAEPTTGPLAQGLGNSVGLALAERMLAARFNRDGHDIVDHHTFAVASDGDLQEGLGSEACSLAGHLGLGRLIVFYDDNRIQPDGPTEMAFSENVPERFEAYGWHVENLGEDLELERIEEATRAAMEVEDRPSLVILRTHIAEGSPNKQDSSKAHGSPLGAEEVELTKKAYGWPTREPFYIPEEALAHFRQAVDRGAQLEEEWDERAAAYEAAHPDLWHQLKLVMEKRLPDGWSDGRPRFDPSDEGISGGGSVATRKASHDGIQWAAERLPSLVGGAADLSSSTLTTIEDSPHITAGNYEGRNINFGVREHAMGAIVNGLNLHGFRAFGSTFLQFSDYMKNPIRLAALMKLPSMFFYTHDSIGLGEDGPTHQPIEHLAGLRAIPGLTVLRPGDANETAAAWRTILEDLDGPAVLALSRQDLPVLADASAEGVARGAYVLRDADDPAVVIVATGGE